MIELLCCSFYSLCNYFELLIVIIICLTDVFDVSTSVLSSTLPLFQATSILQDNLSPMISTKTVGELVFIMPT